MNNLRATLLGADLSFLVRGFLGSPAPEPHDAGFEKSRMSLPSGGVYTRSGSSYDCFPFVPSLRHRDFASNSGLEKIWSNYARMVSLQAVQRQTLPRNVSSKERGQKSQEEASDRRHFSPRMAFTEVQSRLVGRVSIARIKAR